MAGPSTPLRVAVLAPISWRTPPRHYGPWELFASLLAEGLVVAGLDVTLFATADSRTAARLVSVTPAGWSEDATVEPKVVECLHIAEVFERAADFDVIHNSFDFLPLTYSRLVRTPVLTTIHGFSSPGVVAVYERYNDIGGYVAISDADRHPRLRYLATIRHGIDTDRFDLHPDPGGYLLFFGRIHPDKGTARAIEVARRVDVPLVIAGIVQDQAYFDECVLPHIDGVRVSYLGPVGAEGRSALLGGADALLHLVSFEEPFGFSVAEAMACGTPVVAYRRGSMPELIDEGVSGYLVDTVAEAVAAVGLARRLPRAPIRAGALAGFSRRRMIDEYLAAYGQLLGESADPLGFRGNRAAPAVVPFS